MNVKERADAIGTFRFISVRLMETTALWVPLIPEMEVKVMLGRHIWDFAQHADALGRRTFELRQPEHYTRRATDSYVQLLERVARAGPTAEKLAQMYEVIVPGLTARYQSYLAETDQLLDAPSVVVMERIITDLTRQVRDAADLRARLRLDARPVSDDRAGEMAITSVVA